MCAMIGIEKLTFLVILNLQIFIIINKKKSKLVFVEQPNISEY